MCLPDSYYSNQKNNGINLNAKKFIISCLLAMTLSPLCLAEETLIFASPEDLPPKIYKENGVLKGTYVDIIRAVCKRMKCKEKLFSFSAKDLATPKILKLFTPFLKILPMLLFQELVEKKQNSWPTSSVQP